MYEYGFQICDVNLLLRTSDPIKVSGENLLFFDESNQSQIQIDCQKVEEIQVSGDLLDKGLFRLIQKNGKNMVRCRKHGEINSILSYNLDRPNAAKLQVAAKDWDWTMNPSGLWTTLFINHLLLPFQILTVHASYICHNEQGILFTAPSGTGKSTQAELWRQHRGAEVINGDKAGVRVEEGRAMVYGVPFSGTSGICKNKTLPLRAIVVLSQAPVNRAVRLPASQAVAALYPNVFADQHVVEEQQMALSCVLDLVESVPVFSLACTADEGAVIALENALRQEQDKENCT